jgi:hypothetical protein
MEERMRRNVVFGVAAAVCCLFFSLDAQAFRCGEEIVGTGDSEARVLIKCGKPTFKKKEGAKKSTRTKGDKSIVADNRYAYGKNKSGSKGVEHWYYNCGKDDFVYVLTFEGGVVVREDTDGRGSGASECRGR